MSNLEQQLEVETQQKEAAVAKAETLDGRVAELELQLQTEAQLKHEATEKIQTTEGRVAELQTEADRRHEAAEKVEMLEFRVADLERQLEEQGHSQTDNQVSCVWSACSKLNPKNSSQASIFVLAQLCMLISLPRFADAERVCRDHPAV